MGALATGGALAVEDLVGLGPGSTPAGDDALTGVAAAVRRLAPGLPPETWERLAGSIGALPPTATTEAGRAMLFHAARGRFVAPLAALARALGDPAADLSARTAAVLCVGARSGADMLAGFLALAAALAAGPAIAPGPASPLPPEGTRP